MRDLNYQLKQLCRRNRDGSFATQADRERMLSLFAKQLHEMGFRHMRADSLKPKHVEVLVEHGRAQVGKPGADPGIGSRKSGSGSPRSAIAIRASFPAGRSSAWRSPGHSRWSRA